MKKSTTIIAAVAVLAGMSALGFTAFATQRMNQPTFVVYGDGALSTTAPASALGAASSDAYRAHVNYIPNADGKPWDPSFRSGSIYWKRSDTSSTVNRAKTEFVDANGHRIMIEKISCTDTPTLVFFSHDGPKGPMPVLNAFVASLQKQGIKPIDSLR